MSAKLKPPVPSTKPLVTIQIFADEFDDIEILCKEMQHNSFVSFNGLAQSIQNLVQEALELNGIEKQPVEEN